MYAVVDVETTGFSPVDDRVIEIGIVGLDENAERQWEWGTLINPERDTGRGLAVKVHQIYSRDVENAPTFARFAGYIAHLLSGRVIVGHNVRFDWSMLEAEFTRSGWDVPDVAVLCTMDLARRSGAPSGKLAGCCEWLGIKMTAAHEALADARATAQLANALLANLSEDARSHIAELARNVPPWPPIPTQQWAGIQRLERREALPPPGARLKPRDRVAFTGPLSRPRKEWITRIVEAGLQNRATVSHLTDWLVVASGPTGSTKCVDAEQLGVPVVSERSFERLLAEYQSDQDSDPTCP